MEYLTREFISKNKGTIIDYCLSRAGQILAIGGAILSTNKESFMGFSLVTAAYIFSSAGVDVSRAKLSHARGLEREVSE